MQLSAPKKKSGSGSGSSTVDREKLIEIVIVHSGSSQWIEKWIVIADPLCPPLVPFHQEYATDLQSFQYETWIPRYVAQKKGGSLRYARHKVMMV